MNISNDSGLQTAKDNQGKENPDEAAKSKKEQSDPPLTEIKGVTEPEEYVEPEVEEEEPKKN